MKEGKATLIGEDDAVGRSLRAVEGADRPRRRIRVRVGAVIGGVKRSDSGPASARGRAKRGEQADMLGMCRSRDAGHHGVEVDFSEGPRICWLSEARQVEGGRWTSRV